MDKKLEKEFKVLITKEIEKTKIKIVDYKELTKPIAPENAIGRVSRMDAIQNKSINEASLHVAENKLVGLTNILQRIGEKDFGFCAKCHSEIPHKRLLLMPHSRFCVNCAQ